MIFVDNFKLKTGAEGTHSSEHPEMDRERCKNLYPCREVENNKRGINMVDCWFVFRMKIILYFAWSIVWM